MTDKSSVFHGESPMPHIDVPWMTVPDLCERFGLSGSRVRRLISDRAVIGLKFGKPAVFYVPETFIDEGSEPADSVEGLAGTITLLSDAEWHDAEIIEWLHTEDLSLGTTPIGALRAGARKPVRRSAQLLV